MVQHQPSTTGLNMETKDNPQQTKPMAVGPDGVVGDLLPEAKARIIQAQQQQQQLAFQIGQMEIEKHRKLEQIRTISEEAQKLINAEAARLGIPDGAPWQITGEGKAILIPQQQQPGMQPGDPGLRPAPITELSPKDTAPEPPAAPEAPADNGDTDPEGGTSE